MANSLTDRIESNTLAWFKYNPSSDTPTYLSQLLSWADANNITVVPGNGLYYQRPTSNSAGVITLLPDYFVDGKLSLSSPLGFDVLRALSHELGHAIDPSLSAGPLAYANPVEYSRARSKDEVFAIYTEWVVRMTTPQVAGAPSGMAYTLSQTRTPSGRWVTGAWEKRFAYVDSLSNNPADRIARAESMYAGFQGESMSPSTSQGNTYKGKDEVDYIFALLGVDSPVSFPRSYLSYFTATSGAVTSAVVRLGGMPDSPGVTVELHAQFNNNQVVSLAEVYRNSVTGSFVSTPISPLTWQSRTEGGQVRWYASLPSGFDFSVEAAAPGGESELDSSAIEAWLADGTYLPLSGVEGATSAEALNGAVVLFNTGDAPSYLRMGRDLIVSIGAETAKISNWFSLAGNIPDVEFVQFSPGYSTKYSQTSDEISRRALTVEGSDANDVLIGLSNFADMLLGGGGDDTLIGTDGQVSEASLIRGDTFVGGRGSDDLSGGAAGDTYIYRRGDGNDVIHEQSDADDITDEVQLAGISVDEAGFTRVDNDLKVVLPVDGSILVKDWFSSVSSQKVEFMSFADQRLSAAEITARTGIVVLTDGNDSYTGTAGADIIYGMGGNDTVNGDPASNNGVGDKIYGGDGDDTISGLAGNDLLYGQRGNDKLYGGDGSDVLDGGEGNDLLDGGKGADTVIGGAGDDVLGGEAGSADSGSNGGGYFVSPGAGNTYIGGTGNDTLRGTGLSDLYEFNLGDGHDTVIEPNIAYAPTTPVDVIRFGTGIVPGDLTALRNGSDLILRHANGTDSVTVKSWFTNQTSTLNQVEEVQFSDGTVWRAAELTSRCLVVTGTDTDETLTGHTGYANTLDGGAGNDTITGGSLGDKLYGGLGDDKLYGVDGADELYGGAGNDLLDGGKGRDLLVGGEGDDTLGGGLNSVDQGYNNWMFYQDPGAGNVYEGGAGADTLHGTMRSDEYRFNLGDGADLIIEPEISGGPTGQVDVLKFGPGITAADVAVYRVGTNLVLELPNKTDKVTIKDWFSTATATARQLERVEFSDGTVWLASELTARGLVVTGTDGADVLVGLSGYNNTLYGGGDNDQLTGANMGDQLYGQDGNDKLYGTDGADELYGGAGNDLLDGGKGRDLLVGGEGADTLGGGLNSVDQGYNLWMNYQDPGAGNVYEGGAGSDTLHGTMRSDEYRFNLGDGVDTLIEPNITGGPMGQVDILKFGPGIAAADVLVRRNGADLVLAHINGSDSVTIKNWYTYQGSTANQVEEVQFADGTIWSASQLTERGLTVEGSAAGEALTGLASYSNTLFGEGGNDTLNGGSLTDTLYGGAGNDALNGGAGNDIYRYFAGDGYDTLTDSGGASDTLEFMDVGVSAATFYKVGNDLEVFLAPGQGVLVKNQFATGGAVEFMLFGGQSYSASQIAALASPKP